VLRVIDGLTNADSIPVLERLMQFAGQRHRLIVHNIANLDTPHYRPVDVDPKEFQSRLREAVEHRRETFGATGGELKVQNTRSVQFTDDGVTLTPTAAGRNILFHDRNDRDPERIMQDLVENFSAFRAAADLLRSRYELINTAIRERI
jgi:flagellar basal-body rod protein FlgB